MCRGFNFFPHFFCLSFLDLKRLVNDVLCIVFSYIMIPLTTGLKNYWYSPKRTVFDGLTLYKHCTALYRTLIYTVHYCTSLYVSTDLYCTVLNNTVRFYWLALYSTEQRCTFWLTRTVQHWTTLYRILTCTVHYWTVQNGYTDTYWVYTTVQHWTGIQTHTVHYCTVIITLWFKFVLFFLFFFLIKSI